MDLLVEFIRLLKYSKTIFEDFFVNSFISLVSILLLVVYEGILFGPML